MLAVDLRRRRSKPHTIWHLDEVYLKIDGRLVYLWRAVDAEGEVLDVLVLTRRNEWAIDARAVEEIWLCSRQAGHR
jgi:transposase-like protein